MRIQPCKCGALPELRSDGECGWRECMDCGAIGKKYAYRFSSRSNTHFVQLILVADKSAEAWNAGAVSFQEDAIHWKQGEPWGNALDGRWLLVFFHVDFKLGAPRIVRWGNFHRPPRESTRDAWFDDHGREIGLKPIKWALIDFDLPPKEQK